MERGAIRDCEGDCRKDQQSGDNNSYFNEEENYEEESESYNK